MNFLTPSYFSRFECSASSCPDSCCRAGWLIPIDSETYGFYGKCGIDIEKNTFSEDGDRVFRLNADGSCVYLNGDGLCELFIRTGRQCEICTKYPRFFEEYDGFCEAGLALSCPTAADLILGEAHNPYTDLKRRSGDRLLQFLADARSIATEMIYSEPEPDIAAKKLLGYGLDMQELIDFDCLTDLRQLDFSPYENAGCDPEDFRKFILENTEILGENWRSLLETEPHKPVGCANERRSYLGYLTYRYFLKAINTEDVFSQCRLIYCLYRLACTLCGDFRLSARLICRELEHDAENMQALTLYLSEQP